MHGDGGSDLTVVKLGGSLLGAPELRDWLGAVAAMSGPCLVVPGGGPFADAVRATQAAQGFDDLAAHRMAILAMQQYGLLLAACEPRLRLVEGEAELAALHDDAAAGVWLPWAMIGRDRSIAASWQVTSDSLALILATRLRARRLLLVKSGDVPAGERSAEELARTGLIDAAFHALRPAFAGEVAVVNVRDRARAEAGCRILAGLPAAGNEPM